MMLRLWLYALRMACRVSFSLSWAAQVGELGNRQDVILSGEEGTLEVKYSTLGGGEIRGIRTGEKDFHTLEIPQELWGANDPNVSFRYL